MAKVTLNALNNRQRSVLAQQNERLLQEGKIPPGLVHRNGKLYDYVARCSRCDQLDFTLNGIKPIEEFRIHGSRPNGLSTWCETCLSSGLDMESAIAAVELMESAGKEVVDSVILIENEYGEWLPASSYRYPIETLYAAIARKMNLDYLATQERERSISAMCLLAAAIIITLGIGFFL